MAAIEHIKPGEYVRTRNNFGSPYLASGHPYKVESIDPDGCLRLAGRLGAWPRLDLTFEALDEVAQRAADRYFDDLCKSFLPEVFDGTES